VVRPAAGRDLDAQTEYIADGSGLDAALRFNRAAEQSFNLIGRYPAIGARVPYRNPLFAGVRMLRIKSFPNHLIFYRPLPNGAEVIRVIHGARDIEKLFEE
jgi:toxin ParE1/3/4